ncbi:MAG TPA: hypothetical protein VHZ96_24580 [Frankiaceae bacterium]|jgi:hypothetical protein|nr:hypothetical protein [Frankiaceae bacterium]
MTLQIDTSATISSEFFARSDTAEGMPSVFVGGWSAAREYVAHRPNETETTTPGQIAIDGEVNIFAPQIGVRNQLSALRARRRLNQEFRRNQHAFEHAMDAVAHDPAGQSELQSIWTSRR